MSGLVRAARNPRCFYDTFAAQTGLQIAVSWYYVGRNKVMRFAVKRSEVLS